MKPVINKQTHYSLLLMRDDSDARKYRVHSRVLRFFVYLFLLLLAGGAIGIAGGIHYWEKYKALTIDYEAQGREASEMRLQLERLIALESVLSASNGTVPSLRYTQIGANQPLSPNDISFNDASSTGDVTVALDPGANTDANQATQPIADNSAPSGNDTSQQEPMYPRISSQESPLRVVGLSSRATGQQRLSIRFELITEGNTEQRMIAGHVSYFAILPDGIRVELPIGDGDGSRFSIARMRLMQNSLRVPQEFRATDVEKIDLLIELSDGKRFEERFDVGGN
jgi:hypothetical protein